MENLYKCICPCEDQGGCLPCGEGRHDLQKVPATSPAQGTPEPPKEARQIAERFLMKELGFAFLAQNSALTVTIFKPKFRVASLHQLDKKWDVVYLMDKAWELLIKQQMHLSATPASTARTDGKFPLKWSEDAFVLLAGLRHSVIWELAPEILQEITRLVEAALKIHDAAPGSVPHKANLLDEDKSLRPTSKGFVGVPQASDPLKDDSRCAVCGWPLAESREKGCVRGNCSQRPLPFNVYDLERANREYIETFGIPFRLPAPPTGSAQPGDAPQKEKP